MPLSPREEAFSAAAATATPTASSGGLTAADWALFALVLVATAAAGVFDGCFRLASAAGAGPSSSSSGYRGTVLELRRKGGATDLAFLFVCYSTFAVTIGLPSHAYFHGLSPLLWCGPPAAAAGLVAALVLVLPVFSADNNPFSGSGGSGVGVVSYLKLRFESKAVDFLARALIALTWAVVVAATIAGLSSLLRASLSASSTSSLSSSASVVVVVAVVVVYIAVEGKSNLLWSDFALSILLFGSLIIAASVGISFGSSSSGLNGDDDPITGPNPAGGLYTAAGDAAVRRRGLLGRVSERPLVSEESHAAVFFGQFFVWLCAFVAFYTSDPRYARQQSDSSTLLLLSLQLLPLAATFGLLAVLGAAMAATVPLFPSDGGGGGGDRSAVVADCDNNGGGSTSSSSSPPDSPDGVAGMFFNQRLGGFHGLPGFPGLILAAVFGISVSTISTGCNFIVECVLISTKKKTSAIREALADQNGLLQRTASMRAPDKEEQLRQMEQHRRRLSGAQQVRQRFLAALLALLSGVGAAFLRSGGAYANVAAAGGVAGGVLLGLIILGLFFPYATGRGAFLGALVSLAACHWLSVSGALVADAGLGISAVDAARGALCGGAAARGGHGSGSSFTSSISPHLPTGLQPQVGSGSSSPERDSPGFLIPHSKGGGGGGKKQQQPGGQQQQQQQQPPSDTFLPRSPVFGSQGEDDEGGGRRGKKKRRRKKNRGRGGGGGDDDDDGNNLSRWKRQAETVEEVFVVGDVPRAMAVAANSGSGASPHQPSSSSSSSGGGGQQQQRGSGGGNPNSKSPSSPLAGSNSNSGGGSPGSSPYLPQSPSVMNKPPLVLAKPEDEEGGGGGDGGADQRNRFRDRVGGGGGGGESVEHAEDTSGIVYQISYHFYGWISMGCTVLLGLLFSLRPPASSTVSDCVAVDDEDADEVAVSRGLSGDHGGEDGGVGENGAPVPQIKKRDPAKKFRVMTMDTRLLHPIARRTCCRCCTERRGKKGADMSFSMEKRRSQMVAVTSIEEPAASPLQQQVHLQNQHLQLDPRHYRQGSVISRQSLAVNGSQNGGGLSRRCSRHSQHSKRSSLGSGQYAPPGAPGAPGAVPGAAQQAAQQSASVAPVGGANTTTTQADVLAPSSASPAVSPRAAQAAAVQAHHIDLERRLSQLSDTNEVENMELARRNSGSSGNAGYHRRISPQMSLAVPGAAGVAPLPSPSNRLAPPSESELQAQRRFSEHAAAVERHNSRRAAKRSKSVMYRNTGAGGAGKRRTTPRRNSDLRADFDPYAVAAAAAAQQQQQPLPPPPPTAQQVAHMRAAASGLAPPAPLQATLSAPSPSRRF